VSAGQTEAWLRGEELEVTTGGSTSEGVVILFDPDNRCLGRGRRQAGKIKNLLPRRLI